MKLEPSAETATLRSELLALERAGPNGYAVLQDRLSLLISPGESSAAETKTGHAIRAFTVALIVVALLELACNIGLDAFMPFRLAQAVVPAATAVWLIVRHRIEIAGRVLIGLSTLRSSGFRQLNEAADYDAMTFGPVTSGLALALALGFLAVIDGFLLGTVLDYGLSQRPQRYQQYLRRFVLLVGAFGTAVWFWQLHASGFLAPTRVEELVYFLAPAAMAALAIGGNGLLMKRHPPAHDDVTTLFEMGIRRWQRRWGGKIMAIFCVIGLLLCVLNGFAVAESLDDEAAGSPPIVLRSPDGSNTEVFLLWAHRSRVLREADIGQGDGRFFVFPKPPVEFVVLTDRVRRQGIYQFEPLTEPQRDEMLPKLAGAEVRSAREIRELVQQAGGGRYHVWSLWRVPKKWEPHLKNPKSGETRLYALEPLHYEKAVVARAKALLSARTYPLYAAIAAVFFGFAFVILWERGGESSIARWISLWLAGVGAVCTTMLPAQMIDVTFTAVSGAPWGPPSGASLVVWLSSVGILLFSLMSLFSICQWMCFRVWRPAVPTLATGRFGGLRRVGGTLLTLCVPLAILAVVALIMEPSYFAACVAGFASTVAICACEWWRTGYSSRPVAADCKSTSPVRVAAWFVLGQIILFEVSMPGNVPAEVEIEMRWYMASLIVVLVLFLALSLNLFLRQGFLNLIAGRDFSFLATAFAVPVVFELMNSTLPRLLNRYGILSEEGATYAAIAIVVALIQPIQRALEAAIRRFANPRLRRAEGLAEQLAEDLTHESDRDSAVRKVEQFFIDIGIPGATLYAREGDNDFLRISGDGNERLSRFSVSAGLQKILSRTRLPVDLTLSPSEWKYFFAQFELHRIGLKTGARFLFPLRQGNSLQGILALPDTEEARKGAREGFTPLVSRLGVMAIRTKPDAGRNPSGSSAYRQGAHR
jgi:hypothetical protein